VERETEDWNLAATLLVEVRIWERELEKKAGRRTAREKAGVTRAFALLA